jgi:hypothetical protein
MHHDYSDFVLITNQLQRPLPEQEVTHLRRRDQFRISGLAALPDIPLELDSIPPGPILTTAKLNDHLLTWKERMMLESPKSPDRHCTKAW